MAVALVYRYLVLAVFLTYLPHAFGFSCSILCPGIFDDADKDKCCTTEIGIPRCCSNVEYHMQILRDGVDGALKDWQGNFAPIDWHENTAFQDNRDWTVTTFDNSRFPTIFVIIAVAALFGIVVTCYVLCLCCPCCILYKRRKRGAVYRRVVTPTVTIPQVNQTSVTVVASHPPEVNLAQPSTVEPALVHNVYNQAPQPVEANVLQPSSMGPTLGYSGYNQVPHPQGAMQPPPPYSVAVANDPYPKQAPYNPLYQQ